METIQRLLFLLYITTYVSTQKNGCLLKYVDFPHKEPVFYKTNQSIIEPVNNGINLKSNEEIIISCPGAKNTLLITQTKQTTAKCVKNNILKVFSIDYNLSQLNCSKDVVGEVNVTTTPCGNNRGVIKNIGHLNDKKFNTLFSICYDDNLGESIYSKNIIYGSAIKNSKKDSSRPGFKTPGLAPGVSAEISYKQITQKSTFSSILGSSQLAEYYIHNKSHLARGHLAPDGDFIYVSSQHSTYFYINTLPQWQVINNGNWKSLEFSIRNIAGGLNKTIHVWTGGYQTLKLLDIKGKVKDMYLVPLKKLLPIPKFVWKVVYEPKSRSGMGFVTINNPFLEEVEEEDVLCEDVCEENGWNVASWKNPKKGYTYCCNVEELRKKISTIPYIGSNKNLKNL